MIRRLEQYLAARQSTLLTLALLPLIGLALWLLLVPDRSRMSHTMDLAFLAMKPAAEYALVSGEQKYLEETARVLERIPGIRGLELRDAGGLRIYRSPGASLRPGIVYLTQRMELAGRVAEVGLYLDPYRLDPVRTGTGLAIGGLSVLALITLHLGARGRQEGRMRAARALSSFARHDHDDFPEIEIDDPALRLVRDALVDLKGRMNALHEQYGQERDKALAELYARIDEIDQKNRELEHQRLQAEEANREKSIFLANISHELRTPLNAIMGVTDHLMKSSEHRREIELIHNASRHLLSLIDQILLANRALATHTELHWHDVHELVREVLEVLEQNAFDKNLWLIYDPSPRIGELETDEMRFRQILTNLLSNAIKFTLKGGVSLRTRLTDEALDLQIIDTGPGIPERELVHLMQPFSRRNHESREGFGLGLYITQSLCDTLGYELRYERDTGGGSIFHVLIPRRHAGILEDSTPDPWAPCAEIVCDTRYRIFNLPHEHQVSLLSEIASAPEGACVLLEHPDSLQHPWPQTLDASTVTVYTPFLQEAHARLGEEAFAIHHITERFRSSDERPTSPSARLPGQDGHHLNLPMPSGSPWSGLCTVLADDNPTNLEVLNLLLEDEGMQLFPLSGAESLVEQVVGKGADLVLVDGHMPDMDPVAIGRRLRVVSPLTRIVFVSADVFLDSRIPTEVKDGFLTKPVSGESLRQVLARNIAACFEPGNISNITSYHSKTVRRIFQLSMDDLAATLDILEHPERLNGHEFHELAHRLNGTGKYCGGTRLIELCIHLETLYQEGEELEASAIVSSARILAREIRRLIRRIEDELHQLDQLESGSDAD